jgi:hypothetical protein
MSNVRPLNSRIPVGGSGTGVPAIAVADTVEVYTPRLPAEVPSMFRAKSESENEGSLVENNGKPVLGSRRKTDKASGRELGSGPFVVASSTKEKAVPSVRSVRYSLKNDDGESIKVTVPGSVPVTSPVGKTAPNVPLVEKSEMVTVLDADPPFSKSKASCAEVPVKPEVLTVIEYIESARKLTGINKMVRFNRTTKTKLSNQGSVLHFLTVSNVLKHFAFMGPSRDADTPQEKSIPERTLLRFLPRLARVAPASNFS